MSIKVTREQVAAARIVHALDQAEGRQSDRWIQRLLQAKKSQGSTKSFEQGPPRELSPTTKADQQAQLEDARQSAEFVNRGDVIYSDDVKSDFKDHDNSVKGPFEGPDSWSSLSAFPDARH